MTREEAVNTILYHKHNVKEGSQIDQALDMAINALRADGDTISRQAAIDEINERQRKLIYCFSFENDMVKIMDIARSVIIAMPPAQQNSCEFWDDESNFCALHRPSAQPEQQWIPVSSGKLPEDGAEVWVTTDMLFEVTRARWHKDTNLWCHPYNADCLLVLSPIAWMEMSFPEPYKGGVE